MFCEIVSQISFSWGPIDLELALGNAVVEPVEAHVNGFGLILVGSDWGGRLPVPQFDESELVGDCHTGIEVASTTSENCPWSLLDLFSGDFQNIQA